jgi:hypothetical protein
MHKRAQLRDMMKGSATRHLQQERGAWEQRTEACDGRGAAIVVGGAEVEFCHVARGG